MESRGNTTIEVKKATRDKLKKVKIHQRQSYDEVINEVLTMSGMLVMKSKEVKNK